MTFRLLIQLLLALAFLPSIPSLGQSETLPSSFTVIVNAGRVFVTGTVDSEETKEKVSQIIKHSIGRKKAETKMLVDARAKPFPIGWETTAANELRSVILWKSGDFTFTHNLDEDKRLFVPYLMTTKVIEPGKPRTAQLINPNKKVTLINLFAIWALPARSELPVLSELYRKYSGEGLDVISVDADDNETAIQILKFKRDLSLKFRVASSNNGLMHRMVRISQFMGIPQTFVIRDDKIEGIFRGAGAKENKKLVDLVDSLFAQ